MSGKKMHKSWDVLMQIASIVLIIVSVVLAVGYYVLRFSDSIKNEKTTLIILPTVLPPTSQALSNESERKASQIPMSSPTISGGTTRGATGGTTGGTTGDAMGDATGGALGGEILIKDIPQAIRKLCESNTVKEYKDVLTKENLYGMSTGDEFIGETEFYDDNGNSVGKALWSDTQKYTLKDGSKAFCSYKENECPVFIRDICQEY